MKLVEKTSKFKIYETSRKDGPEFWEKIGPVVTDRDAINELEGPIYDDENYVWLIALEGRELAAVSSLSIDTQKKEATYEVTYIRPPYRDKGLYALIFMIKEDIAKGRGISKLKGLANASSKTYFDKSGWTLCGARGKWNRYEKVIKYD